MSALSPARGLPRLTLARGALFSPWTDFLLTSGLSIAVVGGMILFSLLQSGPAQGEAGADTLGKLLLLQVLINWPHFMVSYWVLYSNRNAWRDYPGATVIVPVALVAIAYAASFPAFGGSGIHSLGVGMSTAIWIFAGVYLAWHYTGQTWGVMMSFAKLSGLRLGTTERMVLRNGLRVMVGWHVVWAIQTLGPLPYMGPLQSPAAMTVMNLLAVLAFGAGAVALWRAARRCGSIDLRVLGAWGVMYMWYLLLYLWPEGYLVVQLSHALQYLGFPLRLELNRPSRRPGLARLAGLYAICVLAGAAVFLLPSHFVVDATQPSLLAMIGVLINIHHYYTDSAIWKLRRSEVSAGLFGHVK
ncbi:MAG: hypothetical protein RIR62_256 [Pseudomonadota bacterium]